MYKYEISGVKKLKGQVTISGSKNAALPCLFASLLTKERCILENVPNLVDIDTTLKLLTELGKHIERTNNTIEISERKHSLKAEARYDLVRKMRASILVLGPLLARLGQARVSLPGGCAIGARPINYHLDGLREMGAGINLERGFVMANSRRLKGREITMAKSSVGATENLLMAASLASGTTIINRSAVEPEVQDLAHFLLKMGADISGIGTDRIVVKGKDELHGSEHTIIPDRIETGTYLSACAITKGELTLNKAAPQHIKNIIRSLEHAGLKIVIKDTSIFAKWVKPLNSVSIHTEIYPGFPTDMQAQWMALMSMAKGAATISETIFEHRFLHVLELARMGARIELNGNSAKVYGPAKLSGCPVMVSDLRAGAGLVLAGLAASGITTVLRIYHLDRGYEHLEKKLQAVGANIKRLKA